MIIPFIRSSLLNTASLCEGRLFIEYNIGHRGEANIAALTGSTVHGVMELLAFYKLASQQGKTELEHDSFGKFPTDPFVQLDETSLRDWLTEISYSYYNKESPGIFEEHSPAECRSLVDQALDFMNGAYDPRRSNVYAAELPFDIVVEEDWAKYEYEESDGNIVKGSLQLKGTIDLIVNEDDETLHVIDYKTNKSIKDWVTDKEKTELSLYKDQQMMFYFYVISKTFPNKNIIMTLFFIRLQKVFTLVFTKEDLKRIEQFIKDRYLYFQSLEKPSFIDGTKIGWKCRFCSHSKNKQPGTKLSVCKFFQRKLATHGYDAVMKEHANYQMLNNYGSGGSSKGRK